MLFKCKVETQNFMLQEHYHINNIFNDSINLTNNFIINQIEKFGYLKF